MKNKKIIILIILVLLIATGCILFLYYKSFSTTPVNSIPANTASNKEKVSTKLISSLILPYAETIKNSRQEFLENIANLIAKPTTIILLLPNYAESGQSNIQTTDKLDELTINTDVVNQIKDLAPINSTLYTNDNLIKPLLNDISNFSPNSKVVPITIKQNITASEIDTFNLLLNKVCKNCLLITSENFSNQLPLLASIHNDLTKRFLEQLDFVNAMNKSETDSAGVLALTIKWAESHNTNQLVSITEDSTETDFSPFMYYTTGDKVISKSSVSFIIGGDMMFGRGIAYHFLAKGLPSVLYNLGNRLFAGTDASIVNLEGPISKTPLSVPSFNNSSMVFNFPPETIDALKYLKVNVASQANNHSGNAGKEGLDATRNLLTKAGIAPVGEPDGFDPSQIATIEGNGLTLYILGVDELWSQPDLTKEIKRIKEDSKNKVIVFPHWGIEYNSGHSKEQESSAHSWIDAGADIVIGAHPHVIEDSELYKNKPIFYSMGNLLFDQTFSVPTQQGLIIAGKFTETQIEIFVLPTQSMKYKPSLMSGLDRTKILSNLYNPFSKYIKDVNTEKIIIIPNN